MSTNLRNPPLLTLATFILSMGIPFLMHVVLARSVSQSDYGIFSYATAFSSIISLIAGLGFSSAMIRFISEYESTGRSRIKSALLGTSLRMTAKSSVFYAVLIAIISLLIPNQTKALMWTAVLIIPTTLALWRENTVRAFGNVIKALAPRNIIAPAIMISVLMSFAIAELTTILATYAIILIFIECLAIQNVRKKHNFNMKSPPRRMRLQWLSISAPMGFTALINFAITRWDVIAVGALLGMKDAATYSVASRVAILVGVFLRLLNIIISPVLANHYYRKEYQRYRRTILIATVASAMLGIPIYALIFFYSEHLLALFGHEYIISIPILQILAFGQMCNVLTGPSGIALAMSGKEKHNFVFSCIGSTLSLVGIVLLTPKFGISGTAIATTSGVVLINLFQLISCFIFVRNIAK